MAGLLKESFVLAIDTEEAEEYLHITSHPWVSIYPPSTPNSCLPVEDTKLIKAEDFLQATGHSNTTLPSTNDRNGVICIAPRIVSIVLAYGVSVHLANCSY